MSDKQFTKVSFYVVAHADDWQLFMQPNAYNDLVAPDSKVVFIITTAGDAGFGQSYWSAREEGLKSSVRFCLAPLGAIIEKSSTIPFNQHTVKYWSANNVTCYFLRFPDGNLDGKGFNAHDYQSLTKLKEGQISNITAVDKSTTYNGWPDFLHTLEMVIMFESNEVSFKFINYINPDSKINPQDHADHTATGQAVQNITIISTLPQYLYSGYNVISKQQNLHPTELFWKAGMFAVYEKAVYDSSGYSTLQENISTYIQWSLSTADFLIINPSKEV